MPHKKYYGYKPKYEYYSVTLYQVDGEVGESIVFDFDDGKCVLTHLYWGCKLDYEYSRDGEVEHSCIWDKENTKKLMFRTNTRNGSDLVRAIYDRFHLKERDAAKCIMEWCDTKEIKYDCQVWY